MLGNKNNNNSNKMGICISVPSSEIHEAPESCHENGIQNAILVEQNVVSNESKKLASVHSKQGSKGVNQDAAVLCQVCVLLADFCFF